MNIDWVIPCRFVEVHDNLATIIGAGIDTFWLPEIPSPVQVILVARLLGTVDELDPSIMHTITNRVFDPRGDLHNEESIELAVGGTSASPDWLVGISLPFACRFEAAEQGTYTIEVSVDDASKSLPIHVVHGLPPGMSPASE
jgi:hypothetical protein